MTDSTHPQAFDEGRLSTNANPLVDLEAQDFPFDEIFRKLDGEDDNAEARIDALTEALKVFLLWAAEPYKRTRSEGETKLKDTGKRVLAALWVINPGCFQEGPISAAELSRQIGNNRVAISEGASEFTRRFGIRNRYQAHGRSGEHADRLVAAVQHQNAELQ